MTKFDTHDAAGIFPLMGDAELHSLADDIKKHGQREPIIVWGSRGQIVDGRNRARACELVGVVPLVSRREFNSDEDAVWFSVSQNLKRRHLAKGQEAMVVADADELCDRLRADARARQIAAAVATNAARAAPAPAPMPSVTLEENLPQAQPQERAPQTRDNLGALAGVSGKTMAAAIKVRSAAPELAEAVRQNVIPVNMAEKVTGRPVEEQRAVVQRIADGSAKNVPQAVRQLEEEKRKDAAASLPAPVGARIELGSALDHLDCFSGAHCVVTDPPYGIDTHRTRDGGQDYADGSDYALDLLDKTMAGLSKRIDPSAHLYVFSGYTYVHAFKEVLSRYFDVQDNPIIWAKTQQTMCDFSRWYASKHEYVLFARMRGSNRPLKNGAVGDVFTFARGRDTTHSAEKPVDLLATFIEQSTAVGELVADPFTGSGSTAVASLRASRRFVGTEIDPEFRRLAEARTKGAPRAA